MPGETNMFYSRVQTIFHRRRKQKARITEISAPFDVKREPLVLPGVSEIEIALLREKAAGNRPANLFDAPPPRHSRVRSKSAPAPPARPPVVVTVPPPYAVLAARPVW